MNRLSPAIIEIKRASVDERGTFEGYASTWGGPPDSYGDIIEKGAFVSSLAKHKTDGTQPAMLWSHNHEEPIGRWLEIREDSKGLLAVGRLTLGIQRGKEARELLQDDAIAMSIGFVLAKDGSRTDQKGIRTITRIGRLAEISLVSMPANSRAKVTAHKQIRPESRKQYEHMLRDVAGFSARESKRLAAGGFGALVRNGRSTDLSQVLTEIQELRNELRGK